MHVKHFIWHSLFEFYYRFQNIIILVIQYQPPNHDYLYSRKQYQPSGRPDSATGRAGSAGRGQRGRGQPSPAPARHHQEGQAAAQRCWFRYFFLYENNTNIRK